MSKIEQRKLSRGEQFETDRKRFTKQPHVKTQKKPRRKPKGPPHNAFIDETARAWGLPYKDVYYAHRWVGRNIYPEYRGIVFTKLLRKKLANRLNPPQIS